MQQEQRELLQALYEEHVRALRFVAYGKRIPSNDVDDVIQDTFCSFIEAYGEKFVTWNRKQIKAALMRILYNRCVDYYREKIRHPDTSIEDYVKCDEYRIVTEMLIPDVEEHIMAKDRLAQIRDGIAAMSPALKDVAILCLVERRTIGEVCQLLKINESTCRMRLYRIRKYLAEWIKEE